MASPFKKKSPLNAYKYSLTSEYAKPKRVIQPIVEADAAKAIEAASKKVLGVYSKIEADKLAKTASDEAGDLKHQRAMEVKWGKGNTGPAVKPASHEENMSNFGLTSFKDVQAERDAKDFMNRDFGGNKDSNSLVDIGRAGKKPKPKTPYIPPSKAGRGRGENVGYIPYHHAEKGSNGADRSMAMMKGSPNKLIGDTMDPYGQPQRGNRDFTFNEKGIAPGTLGNQASMGVQNEIYGGGQAQVAAEQLASQAAISPRADEMDLIGNLDSSLAMKGTPLHTEGHGGAKDHTHAKPGDDLDQTVAENMGVNDIENYKPIQGFKGGQIVVNSQNKDTIFSKTYPKRHGSTFVIPEQMDNITRSSEGTPEYKPVYINRNKKQ